MDTDGIANELDTFASWPRAFTCQELLDFADSEIDRDTLQRTLLSDCRFIRLGPKDDYFIPTRALFRWFSCLSLRLTQAHQARLDERQLAMAMSSLRAAGRWDVPLPEIIEFGQRFGFCGRAWTPQQYVFPVARVLSFASPASARRALERLERLAEAQGQELLPEESLVDSVQNALSGLPDRLLHVLRAREGLQGGRRMTLEEIGRPMGVTRERVRQLETQVWKTIHHYSGRKAVLVHALLHETMARQGRLIFDPGCPEAWARRFAWKFAGLPWWEVPETGWVVLGVSSEQAGALDPSKWPLHLTTVDQIADHLDCEGKLCLIRDDLRVIAETMHSFREQFPTKAQRVRITLREIGKHAHYSEVAEVYNDLFPDDPTTERNIHAVLSRQQHGVVWIGVQGTYALKEWGYNRPSKGLFEAVADIVEKQYEATGTPVPFALIAAEMGKLRRVVKSSSLIFATHCNSRLRRVSSDSFVPRAPDDQVEEEIPEDELDRILQEFEENVVGDSDGPSAASAEPVPDMETVPRGRGRLARLGAIVKDAFFAKRDQGRGRNLVEPEGDQRQDEEEEKAEGPPALLHSPGAEVIDQRPVARAGSTRSAAVEQEAGVTRKPPESAEVPSEEQEAEPEYEPLVQPRDKGKEQTDGLPALLRSRGLEVIDDRPHGGFLWVVGGKELYSFLSPRGFVWGPRGASATGNKAGWYFPTEQH